MKNIKKTLAILILSLLFLPLTSFALDVGDQAPGFTANSTLGEVSLADYAGKKNVVLPLYFAVFTSV
ncbi:MAG: hypothetical protein HKP41_19915 [Desulfobacterales bacterium]|nr:hypothetical protein [Deltaproteobacteria bacterium]NNK96621.1 hypothetical protein [Desulfobacterales bacterium]